MAGLLERILAGKSERGAAGMEAFTGLQKGYGAGALAGRELTFQEYQAQKKAIRDLATTAGGAGLLKVGGEQATFQQLMDIIQGKQIPAGMTITPRFEKKEIEITPELRKLYSQYGIELPEGLTTIPSISALTTPISFHKAQISSLRSLQRQYPSIYKSAHALVLKKDTYLGLEPDPVTEPKLYNQFVDDIANQVKILQTGGLPGKRKVDKGAEGIKTFASESKARAAGKKKGDVINLQGIGKVRLD